ncbi:MAG: alpha/beta hydrolase, partial [Actinomycetota bacterium]|nr:alpha/beta hydrolase [Actinomycetota bacterium]
GWGAPSFQTDLMARHLRARGFDSVSVKLPWLATGDLDSSAKNLKEIVGEVLKESSSKRVDMLGYSLGGLIVRVYLQKFGGYKKLRRAVFLGAPQEGIYTGYAASFTKAGKQIKPGSDYLSELNEEGYCGCGERRCLSIYLKRDGVIVPSESARLECGYNLELEWPVFHWGVVMSRGVLEKATLFFRGNIPKGASEGNLCAAP